MSIILRPRQEVFINGIRGEFATGHNSVMGVAPTGFGKTICFSYIAQNAAQLKNTTFILVHRKELIRQTSRSLYQNGIPHGIIASGYPIVDFPIQVCSVQTLCRRLDRFVQPNLLVVDEAHHTPASQYQQIIKWASESALLGVTATPIRADGKGFEDCYQSMVCGPDIYTLIQEGWLSKFVLYAPPIEEIDLSNVSTLAGEYNKGELAFAMDKPVITGSAIEHYKRILPHFPPTVVFCVSIAHAQHTAQIFNESGIPSASIDGTMLDNEREDLINKLDRGDIACLMSCSLVDEGFDLPKISAVIDLAPTKSLSRLIQRYGRGLRIYPGKTECVFLDHVENSRRHEEFIRSVILGEPLNWSLEGRKKRASKVKGSTLATCPKCYSVFPPVPNCPACGYSFKVASKGGNAREIEERDGELVRIDSTNLLSFKSTSAKGRQKQIIHKLERI